MIGGTIIQDSRVTGFLSEENKLDQRRCNLKIGVFLFQNFWWKYYSKISLWYVKKFFQQILSIYFSRI